MDEETNREILEFIDENLETLFSEWVHNQKEFKCSLWEYMWETSIILLDKPFIEEELPHFLF